MRTSCSQQAIQTAEASQTENIATSEICYKDKPHKDFKLCSADPSRLLLHSNSSLGIT